MPFVLLSLGYKNFLQLQICPWIVKNIAWKNSFYLFYKYFFGKHLSFLLWLDILIDLFD